MGVYTQNQVVAAPVLFDRQRTPSDRVRAIVVNSGNANACTGERGMADTQDMARCAAQACGCEESGVLVMSTGIIGEFLPMDRIRQGIQCRRRCAGTVTCRAAPGCRGNSDNRQWH